MKYRFVTPQRAGKWYTTIEAAQRNAEKIGAGYFDEQKRTFYRYAQSVLECRISAEGHLETALVKARRLSRRLKLATS